MKNAIIAFVLSLSVATSACSGTSTYSAGPTEGTVIDADTKKPVPGAVVIALWDLEGGMAGVSRFATLKVAEAVTNEAGQYRIAGWGPVPRPSDGVLNSYDPAIIIFKTGYVPEHLLNDKSDPRGKRTHLEVHDSIWNGKAIALKKYDGPLKAYSRKVASIAGTLNDVLNGWGCAWKVIPKTIRALDDENKREIAAGIKPSFDATAELLIARQACAPMEEFNKAYRENS